MPNKKLNRRRILKAKLRKESTAVRGTSLEVLKETESLQDILNQTAGILKGKLGSNFVRSIRREWRR